MPLRYRASIRIRNSCAVFISPLGHFESSQLFPSLNSKRKPQPSYGNRTGKSALQFGFGCSWCADRDENWISSQLVWRGADMDERGVHSFNWQTEYIRKIIHQFPQMANDLRYGKVERPHSSSLSCPLVRYSNARAQYISVEKQLSFPFSLSSPPLSLPLVFLWSGFMLSTRIIFLHVHRRFCRSLSYVILFIYHTR